VLEQYNGHLCICFKATLALQQLLIEDPRFFKSPYIGHQGWVSLIADRRPNWKEVRQLVRQSYLLVSAKALRSKQSEPRITRTTRTGA
jgi:predicted DNA-binding protein (MmcQ/YjbR family)